jgi:hypothetical protein
VLQLSSLSTPARKSAALAEQLFLDGDFETALLEYQRMHDTSLSPEENNLALYGLACTRMIAADNEDRFIEAIDSLQKWHAAKGDAPLRENRLLLVLALQQQGKRIAEQDRKRTTRERAQSKLIVNQKDKISEMKSTVQKLQTQIEELHNQIAALEAIDENVLEKQKSL